MNALACRTLGTLEDVLLHLHSRLATADKHDGRASCVDHAEGSANLLIDGVKLGQDDAVHQAPARKKARWADGQGELNTGSFIAQAELNKDSQCYKKAIRRLTCNAVISTDLKSQ